MTKQEHKLKSMLNYYEVNLTGGKDEKLNKKDLNKFLDKFNQSMDYYILQDIMSKIKNMREKEQDDEDIEDEIDPMLQPKSNQKPTPKKNEDDDFLFNEDKINGNSFDKLNDPIDTDINKFLRWLTLILYTGDHTVLVTEDKNGIYIKLIKINKGKK